MIRRVALEEHAERSPRLLALEIGQSGAAPRDVYFVIAQARFNIAVATYRPGAMIRHSNDRPGFPEPIVQGVRINQELIVVLIVINDRAVQLELGSKGHSDLQ